MKFRLLLWYLARRMELLARTHPDFIASLHGRDFVLQIVSAERVRRYFHVHNSRVYTHTRLHNAPTLTMTFASNRIGFALLASGNAARFMAAMQAGDVKVEGDYSVLMWFMGVGKYLKSGRKKPRK